MNDGYMARLTVTVLARAHEDCQRHIERINYALQEISLKVPHTAIGCHVSEATAFIDQIDLRAAVENIGETPDLLGFSSEEDEEED